MGNSQDKNSFGFTVLEIIVVLFIMVIMSTIILVSYNNSQTIIRVNSAAQRLAADLRQVQNLALTGKAQGAVIPKGYGLYSQSASQYITFYNAVANSKYASPGSTILSTVVLDGVTLSPTGVTVFFTPPNPSICVVDDTNLPGVSNRDQSYVLSSGSYSKIVTVYQGGRVDIN